MPPTFVGSAIAHANDDQPKTPDFSGVAWSPGDLAIASCWRAVNNGYMNAPDSSWVMIGSRTDSTASARAGRTFYKILEAGEDETPTFTLFNSTASAPTSVVISIWTGVSESNPLDAFSSPLVHNLNDATPTPDPVTTLTPDALAVLWHAAYYATSFSGGAPSGYALDVDYSGATFDDRQQFLASKTITSPGTETPGDWTHSASPGNTEEGVHQTIVLREPQAGDFPQVWGRADTVSSSVTTTHAINMPATVLAGDLLVLAAYVIGSGFTFTSPPSGFTRLDSDQIITATRAWVGWKAASGGEGGGTVGITTDLNTKLVAYVFRIRGWDTSDPPEFAEVSGGGTATAPLTPSWGADTNLYMAMIGNQALTALAASPLNGRQFISSAPSIGSNAGLGIARLESLAGSFTPGTWISSTDAAAIFGWHATLAIKGDVIPDGGDPGPGGTVGVGAGWGISI